MSKIKNNRGQIVVEYVLLLVVAVALGALLISRLVSRNPENPGILTSKWADILTTIGNDIPDKAPKK